MAILGKPAGRVRVFEAGMAAGGALAYADVMVPEPQDGSIAWRMIEVKSSTSVKDYHYDDIAVLCGKQGPVYAYNAGFECGVMNALAARFPEFAPALESIVQRVVDLLPIARNRYYHPSQQGSWSIKAVLPAAIPELSYDQLDGVQDGGMAVAAYMEAIDPATTAEKKAEIQNQLFSYCQLDTFAMVRLWQFFRGNHDLSPKHLSK